MCGLAGIFHFDEPTRPVDLRILTAMTRTLAHRGPDAEGIWSAPGIGLGHRRLSILDLSDAGRQPMLDASGQRVLAYNGEVYNFRELRRELEQLGHRFRSTSDSEVVLYACCQWGPDAARRLDGIFAFAFYDATKRELLLVRDPIGVKPLFYSVVGGTLRFGSEIKAILADPRVPREIDPEALDTYLTFSYCAAPATGLRHVRQLLPGQILRATAAGIETRSYWDCPYEPAPASTSFDQAREQFDALLCEITRDQMVSDVPLGAFLSGGLDSAAIVRAMTRAGAGSVRAFTVGFAAHRSFDEREPARITAEALGVEIEQQAIDMDAADVLPRIAQHMEEPTADSSAVAVWYLCQAARRQFTVAMSGDGADEILAGYETYRATELARLYRRLPGWLRRGLIVPLVRRIPPSDRKYSLHQVANRFVDAAELGAGRDHAAWRIMFSERLKRQVYRPEFLERVAGCDPIGRYASYIAQVPPTRERLAGLLHADTAFYLPNDMLVKVDRMSMAHSLEVRVPFLDPRMVRFCANLPADYKLHRGKRRKHILRESLRGQIPPQVLDRPKSGFNIPIERWMRERLGEMLMDVLHTQRAALEPYLRPEGVEQLLAEHRRRRADHAHSLFAVLMLGLWFDNLAGAWKPQPDERAPVPAPAGRP